jgi:hypothetical protein
MQSSALSQQMFDHSTVSDSARAHFGNSYQNYYGTVYLDAASTTPSTSDTLGAKIEAALRFDGMDMRRATIKLPPGSTCQWFFESPEYKRWRDNSFSEEHHGFLWIRGKPGAGKSTLMRLAVKHTDNNFPGDLRISFFFNAKGTPLEKSIEGMYRTLLYQLLVQCPRLEKVFHSRPWNHANWPDGLLEEHFRDCVLQLGTRKLTCHIDALDECVESDVRCLVEFFEDLGSMAVSSGVEMHVCFASRHYPRISISRCVHLRLDNLEGHQKDIETYVRNNLKVSELALRDQFAEDIRARARDIFLWVVLVVRLLNTESDRGNGDSLRAQLDATPRGLHELYEDAITGRGTDDSRYLVPLLLWVLFATRPLSPSELYHAVLYARNDIDIPVHTPDPSQIERFILNTSKGLVEISEIWGHFVERPQPRVQLIHETVREYLQNGGISRLDTFFCNNPTGLSHDFLKSRCADYMSLTASSIQQSEEPMISDWNTSQGSRDLDSDMFPFLRYAVGAVAPYEPEVGGVVTHAELAQAHGVSQVSFVDAFPLDLVIKLSNLIAAPDGDRYYPSATKTYIFAFLGAPRLLQLELDRVKGGGGLRSRVDMGVVGTADIGAAINSLQGYWGTPLHAAIFANSVSTVKLLLEHGSDANARGWIDKTALQEAVLSKNPDIIRLLLQYGACGESKEKVFGG